MRSVEPWVGKTDDNRPPQRVRVRVFDRFGGVCQCGCQRKIKPGDDWDLDHITALANGGLNIEANLEPILREHHKPKTKKDVGIKAKIASTRAKHIGAKDKPRSSFRTNRDQPFKQKIGGRVVPRELARPVRSPLGTVGRRHGVVAVTTTAGTAPSPATPWRNFELRTSRLLINRMHAATSNHLQQLNNSAHMMYSEQRFFRHTFKSQSLEIMRSVRSESSNNPRLYFYVRLPNNQIVGSMSADLDLRNRRADLGILVYSYDGGKGYGAEAWRAMLEYWLDPLRGNLEKVEAGARADNFAMLKILEKTMEYEGRKLAHFRVGTDALPGRIDAVFFGKRR